MLDDILESPAFWLLGGGAVLAEVIGFIVSKRVEDLPAFPVWQFLLLVAGTLVIAAIIAGRD